MPYIEIKTNTAITKDNEVAVKSKIAAVLTDAFPSKTENWLMVDFTANSSMYFGGKDDPCAMVQIALFGKGNTAGFDKMTDGVCRLIETELGIPADRVYVKYEEVSHWGWNYNNF